MVISLNNPYLYAQEPQKSVNKPTVSKPSPKPIFIKIQNEEPERIDIDASELRKEEESPKWQFSLGASSGSRRGC